MPTLRGVEYRASLGDGTPLSFRPLRADDRELLRTGLEHLSDASRYTRFFRQVKHLSEEQLTYLTELDYQSHYAWVAATQRGAQEGAGICRWIRLADRPETAEVAVTVADAYQRKGIGRTLLTLAMRSALDAGVQTLTAWVLSENRATLEMLKKMGAAPGHWESGVLELIVPLPADPDEIARLAPLTLEPVV
jgi:RimJ/RimL family protein N-acetyltransferase